MSSPSRRSSFEPVNDLLSLFDKYKKKVELKKEIVISFLSLLKQTCDKHSLWITGAEFVGVGSSFGGTVVSSDTDFDIAMILPPPLTMDNFQIVETNAVGLFKLEYMNKDEGDLKSFINDNDYLKVHELRDEVFSELEKIITLLRPDDYSIIIKNSKPKNPAVCSFKVQIQKNDEILELDIVPVIKGNVLSVDSTNENVPGFDASNLPLELKNCIKTRDFHAWFSLAPPPKHVENYGHLVVQTAFDLLETEAMKYVTTAKPPRYANVSQIPGTKPKNKNKNKNKKKKNNNNNKKKENIVPLIVNVPRERDKSISRSMQTMVREVKTEVKTKTPKAPDRPQQQVARKRDQSVSKPTAIQPEKMNRIVDASERQSRSTAVRPSIHHFTDSQSEKLIGRTGVRFCTGAVTEAARGRAIICDSVRIAKFVAKQHNWSKYGLKSFHIERVAISIFDDIVKANEPWIGFKRILANLSFMLENSIICGVFLEGQNVILEDENTCVELAQQVEAVHKKLRIKNLSDSVNV